MTPLKLCLLLPISYWLNIILKTYKREKNEELKEIDALKNQVKRLSEVEDENKILRHVSNHFTR